MYSVQPLDNPMHTFAGKSPLVDKARLVELYPLQVEKTCWFSPTSSHLNGSLEAGIRLRTGLMVHFS